MDLKQLKCFVAVAEDLHFGHAAHRMNILPSALGRHIKLLEEDLGTRLLARSTRHVALTPAGVVLRRDARSILEQVAATEVKVRQLSKVKETALRIGAIDCAAVGLLPTLLGEFKELHPEIETRLVECTSARQLQLLLSGHLDLAFVRPPVRESSLHYEFLMYETLVIAVPSDHALAAKDRIDIHDLAPIPLVYWLADDYGFTDPEAYLFLGQIAEARCTQMVNPKYSYICKVARGIVTSALFTCQARQASDGSDEQNQ